MKNPRKRESNSGSAPLWRRDALTTRLTRRWYRQAARGLSQLSLPIDHPSKAPRPAPATKTTSCMAVGPLSCGWGLHYGCMEGGSLGYGLSETVLSTVSFFSFFFHLPSYMYGVHHSPPSSSSTLPATSVWFIILVLLPSQLYLWVHHSSSSALPAISLGFTILLLLHYQLYLWGSPFFFFLCVPSYIFGVQHSSSSFAFPAISLGFTILLLLLRSQLYLLGSSFFFFFFF